jgi:glycosyltransferase involved in cell wall biosynthesis
MKVVNALLDVDDSLLSGAKIIYDAEAMFTLREVEQLRLEGKAPSPFTVQKMIRDEVGLTARADVVVSVSKLESDLFRENGSRHVVTLGHALEPIPGDRPFADRVGLLFVGAVYSMRSPNADSIQWLDQRIMPQLHKLTGQPIQLILVGPMLDSLKQRCNDRYCRFLGCIDDLRPIYDQARVFVAPTRFAAGIPHKIHEAAAHGLPTVATGLLATQLGWTGERELLVADSSEDFASACQRLYTDGQLWHQVRDGAIEAVKRDCSVQSFSDHMKAILAEVGSANPQARAA